MFPGYSWARDTEIRFDSARHMLRSVLLRSGQRPDALRRLVSQSGTHARSSVQHARRTLSQQPGGGPSLLQQVIAGYEVQLAQRPLLTKSVTSGVLYGIGDAIAQTVERRRAEPTADDGSAVTFDGARWLRAIAYGGLFYPLPAHLHYNFLERLVVVRWATPHARVPFLKMFIEQFVYWSYLSNAYYHAVLGALQGMSVSQVSDRVTSTLWDTLKAQWAFWIPAQLINFKYTPVRHQVSSLNRSRAACIPISDVCHRVPPAHGAAKFCARRQPRVDDFLVACLPTREARSKRVDGREEGEHLRAFCVIFWFQGSWPWGPAWSPQPSSAMRTDHCVRSSSQAPCVLSTGI